MSLPAHFSELAVAEVMHSGVIDCPPQTPLHEVASLMAENNVHFVIVDGLARGPHHTEQLVWGAISDIDLMRAVGTGSTDGEAGEIAATEIVTIERGEEVQRAAQLMGKHECSHLIVTDPDSGRPLAVVSSLDVARALVWGVRPSNKAPTP
ncbi:MAG TPA: CBS domain-containing protein [Solirubrobacteraceae bacterium]|jgi:CBS domain-containing protein|nr:CBS domain-containing protein [Solirubrobacteraceae bacterium]